VELLWVHITVESICVVLFMVAFFLFREREKEVYTFDRELGKRIPILDDDGNIVTKQVKYHFEQMFSLLGIFMFAYYYLFIVWIRPWETLAKSAVGGIYHIVLGLLLPVGLLAGAWFAFKLGIGRGVVVTVQKMVPYRVEKEMDIVSKKYTGVLDLVVDYTRKQSDPCASMTVSLFTDDDNTVKRCATTLRESMNGLHEIWDIPFELLKKNLGHVNFFGDKVQTSFIWYGYVETKMDVNVNNGQLTRSFITWDDFDRENADFSLVNHEDVNQINAFGVTERVRQQDIELATIRTELFHTRNSIPAQVERKKAEGLRDINLGLAVDDDMVTSKEVREKIFKEFLKMDAHERMDAYRELIEKGVIEADEDDEE